MEMQERSRPFGGSGGRQFPPQALVRLAMTHGRIGSPVRVRRLWLNENEYGSGGSWRGEIRLSASRYINRLIIRHSNYVDRIWAYTNDGQRVLAGGWNEGVQETKLDNIRVVSIGGRSGGWIDRIDVTYIEDYVPAETVSNAPESMIFKYFAPNTSLESTKVSSYSILEAIEVVSSQETAKRVGVDVGIEVVNEAAKFAFGTEIEKSVTSSQMFTITTQTRSFLETTEKVTRQTEDQHAFLVGTGRLMRDSTGVIFPVPEIVNFVTYDNSVSDLQGLNGYINFRGRTLADALPADEQGRRWRSEPDPAIGNWERLLPPV